MISDKSFLCLSFSLNHFEVKNGIPDFFSVDDNKNIFLPSIISGRRLWNSDNAYPSSNKKSSQAFDGPWICPFQISLISSFGWQKITDLGFLPPITTIIESGSGN